MSGVEIPLDAGILFATYATLRSPIDADLAAGRSSVVQLVSTGEALMEGGSATSPPPNGTISTST